MQFHYISTDLNSLQPIGPDRNKNTDNPVSFQVLAAVDAKPPAEDVKPAHFDAHVASDEIPEGLQEVDNHGRITVPKGQALPLHPAVGPGHNAPNGRLFAFWFMPLKKWLNVFFLLTIQMKLWN